MSIKFSKHAEDQLKRRAISKKSALETIMNPDEILNKLQESAIAKKVSQW